jgi:hypothetical protein
MKFDVSFALARTPKRFKIKCRELAAGKEKLRARGIYTSLRIDKAQTSSAVSISKDEKKPPFRSLPGLHFAHSLTLFSARWAIRTLN